MSSAATESLPTLRERVGGRWFGSWAMWAISMPAGLLVITSDLTTAASPLELGRWLLVWVMATAVDAVVMWGLQRTVLRGRTAHPWPVWSVVVTGGLFGAFYGLPVPRQYAGFSAAELPMRTVGRPLASTFSRATSYCWSLPTTLALNSRLSPSLTFTSLASATTW